MNTQPLQAPRANRYSFRYLLFYYGLLEATFLRSDILEENSCSRVRAFTYSQCERLHKDKRSDTRGRALPLVLVGRGSSHPEHKGNERLQGWGRIVMRHSCVMYRYRTVTPKANHYQLPPDYANFPLTCVGILMPYQQRRW